MLIQNFCFSTFSPKRELTVNSQSTVNPTPRRAWYRAMLFHLESFFAARIPATLSAFLSALLSAFLSVLFSTLLSPTAHAMKIKLPGDVKYTLQQRFTAQDKKAFSNTSLESSLESSFEQLSISHSSAPLGYMQLKSSGHQQSGQKSEKGTLYLNLVSIPPKGEESSPASRILGIACIKPNITLPDFPTTLAAETMRLTTVMGGRIVGHGQACSSEEPITNQDQDSFQAALSVPDGGYALIMKIEDIDYSTINFTSPTLIVDEKNYPLTHDSSSPTLPESSTLILMYFVPDDQSFHDLHIHMTRASGTAATSAGRELTEQDLQHLANLTTFATLAGAIRASGEMNDDQISTIKEQYRANLNEASFQLLKALLEKKASTMTAEFLAGILESEHHPALAERVRSGKLQITAEDSELQMEMASVGKFLDASAYDIAVAMGLSDKEREAIKDDQNPGYRLLYIAYGTEKLHLLYPKSTDLTLDDLQRQIEQNNRFPLLAALIEKTPSTQQKVKAAPEILEVPFDHVDYDLLRVHINEHDLTSYQERLPNQEVATSLGNKILQLAGEENPKIKNWSAIASGNYATRLYKHQTWGQYLSYGKMLELLNRAKTLEAASTARHIVEYIRGGEVERGLRDRDFFTMAQHRKPSDYKRAIALLYKFKDQHPPQDHAHIFGIRCRKGGCHNNSASVQIITDNGSIGYQGQPCRSLPELDDEIRKYAISGPPTFTHKPL